jgi:hypothetical protein
MQIELNPLKPNGNYREIISLGDENTANARWEPAGTVPVTRQRL